MKSNFSLSSGARHHDSRLGIEPLDVDFFPLESLTQRNFQRCRRSRLGNKVILSKDCGIRFDSFLQAGIVLKPADMDGINLLSRLTGGPAARRAIFWRWIADNAKGAGQWVAAQGEWAIGYILIGAGILVPIYLVIYIYRRVRDR